MSPAAVLRSSLASPPSPPASPVAATDAVVIDRQAAAPAGVKVRFNGFISQAYAASNGSLTLAAVQMRVDVTPEDGFAVQLDHERLGASPAGKFEPDLNLEWLFYERRFGAGSARVGRVKIPFGIYNEVRDVGILLPFYSPSQDFYGLGSFTTETVDGLAVSYPFDLGGGWQLDVDAYGGNWRFLALALDGQLKESKARGSAGGELWLTTPWRGLRLGAGGMRFTAQTPGDPKANLRVGHVSLEWDLGRAVAHAEYKSTSYELGQLVHATEHAGYLHLGVHLSDRLVANAQAGFSDAAIKELHRTVHLDRDLAAGMSYAFLNKFVLKLEHHWKNGYPLDAPVSFAQPVQKSRYVIASVATAF
jgi:hypothetical protein